MWIEGQRHVGLLLEHRYLGPGQLPEEPVMEVRRVVGLLTGAHHNVVDGADDDADGSVDEDWPDDDTDGLVDEDPADDDGDGLIDEDWPDDDGDGLVDEDPADDDADGLVDEDWPDDDGDGFIDEDLGSLKGRDLGLAVAEGMIAFSKSVKMPTSLSELPGFNTAHLDRALAAAKNPQLEMKLKNMPVPLNASLIDEYMGPILKAAQTGDLQLIKNLG